MKAIVQEGYGSPDAPSLREVGRERRCRVTQLRWEQGTQDSP